MTIKELIEELKKLPPQAVIVIAKDAEGNDFSPLEFVGLGEYFPDKPWCGNFVGVGMSHVCFWPVN